MGHFCPKRTEVKKFKTSVPKRTFLSHQKRPIWPHRHEPNERRKAMTIENLEKELKSGQLQSLYLLYGEEL